MYIYFLGTGAGKPSLRRNVSSLLVRIPEPLNEFWLFDCGEGTQHQILCSPLTLTRINRIFITHLHGDHIFGLPGLLASRSFAAKGKELSIYGPRGIKDFVTTALTVSATNLSYPLTITEIEGGSELFLQGWRVKVGQVDHGIPSHGYRLEEPNSPGRLDVEKLQRLKIPAGPIYGKLKQGGTVTLASGEVLDGKDFVGPERRGRHVVIIGDTRYCQAAVDLAKDADVLVHEATFAATLIQRAQQYNHATTQQAAQVAFEANVNQLILTHFSSRYTPQSHPRLLAEARHIFPNTYLAEDHLKFEIPRVN